MAFSEYFGTPDQKRMQELGACLDLLLRDDPRFVCHGRAVQLYDFTDDAVEIVAAIARLVGVSACEDVPRAASPDFRDRLAALGLKTDVISRFDGDATAVDAARAALADRPLAEDLTIRVVGVDSPSEWLQQFADVALPCGVLPPQGSVMRGISRPGFGMVAVDRSGRPVATAGSVLNHSPRGPRARHAQWGQLATIPERQGEGIAKALGAHALIHSAETLGAVHFKTGIKPGNAPSERLCTGLGLRDSGRDIVIGIDPTAFSADRMTA
jgi:GNAT superfamily N-acetyltransferase